MIRMWSMKNTKHPPGQVRETQSAALQQAAVPPQEFESAQGRALASAWAEGWAQCRDAEFVGEEAEHDAFNQSTTLAQCLDADRAAAQVEPSAPPAPGGDVLAARVAELEKDAGRLDYIEENARCEPKMDGHHVWWPTTFSNQLKGPNLRAAIDAALAAKG